MRKHVRVLLAISVLIIVFAFALAVSCSWDIITKGNVTEDPQCSPGVDRDTVFIYVIPDSFGADSLTFMLKGGEILWLE